MAEYRLRLDPEGQAVLEAILGPLAAPQPSTVTGSDLRTSDQRRADALVEVCRRAAAAGGAAPTTPKAAVVVTMDWTDLKQRTGAGTTLTGDLLAPETVRRMACDAAIIPAVLGTRSELLDLGRTVRLATPKLFLALCLRDRGCTFPGCSRPPGWCDAHHGVHWCDGGPTDLTQHGPVVPAAPHDRAPEGLHRHHHHLRGHLAPVAAPPRDPPAPGGSHRHARRRCEKCRQPWVTTHGSTPRKTTRSRTVVVPTVTGDAHSPARGSR